jgi:hypothetical protein
MKLYEVRVFRGRGLAAYTHYRTSVGEAKRLARAQARHKENDWSVVQRVEVRTNLKAEDWILLLEGDAPGAQPQELTPVDLVENREIVARYGREPT